MLNDSYFSLVASMQRTQEIKELEVVARRYLALIGIRHFKYEWVPSCMLEGVGTQRIVSCPEKWMEHYQSENFEEIDPKSRYVRRSTRSMLWTPDVCNMDMPDKERRFWHDSMDFGMHYGATVPLRGRMAGHGALCVAFPANPDIERDSLALLPQLEALAFHIQDAVERITLRSQFSADDLTAREKEVVKWSAAGESAEQICERLNISQTTVLFHIKNAKYKLGATNKCQLVARALVLDML